MDKLFENFMEAVYEFDKHMYEYTTIVVANPFSILELNMSDYPNSVWFISNIERLEGEYLVLKDDSELKRMLYGFCEESPDRFFKVCRE